MEKGRVFTTQEIAWIVHWVNQEGRWANETSERAGFRSVTAFLAALWRSGYMIVQRVVPIPQGVKPKRRKYRYNVDIRDRQRASETRRCKSCGAGNSMRRITTDKNDRRRKCKSCGYENELGG